MDYFKMIGLCQSLLYLRRLRDIVKSTSRRVTVIKPKALILHMLKSLESFIERKPVIRKISIVILNKFPRIKYKLFRILKFRAEATICEGLELETNDLIRLKKIEKMVSSVLEKLKVQK